MRILDFKDLRIKGKCPVCKTKFKYDGLMYHCDQEHFNGYGISFGVKDNILQYIYFDLNRPKNENCRRHYFFCSFQMDFMLFANTKPSGGNTDIYHDIPYVNIDLNKIPRKKYKDYFKTFIIFQ